MAAASRAAGVAFAIALRAARGAGTRARGWRVPGIRAACLAWLVRPGRRRPRLGRRGRPRRLGGLGRLERAGRLLRSGGPPRAILAIPLRARLLAAWLGPLTGVAGLARIAGAWRSGRLGRLGRRGWLSAWRGEAWPGRLRREEVLQGGIHAGGVVLDGVLLVRAAPAGPGRVAARVAGLRVTGLRVVPRLELLAGLAPVRRRVVLLREPKGGSRAVTVLGVGAVLPAGAVAVAALALVLGPEVLGVITGEARLGGLPLPPGLTVGVPTVTRPAGVLRFREARCAVADPAFGIPSRPGGVLAAHVRSPPVVVAQETVP